MTTRAEQRMQAIDDNISNLLSKIDGKSSQCIPSLAAGTAELLYQLYRNVLGVKFDRWSNVSQRILNTMMFAGQTRLLLFLCSMWPVQGTESWPGSENEFKNFVDHLNSLMSNESRWEGEKHIENVRHDLTTQILQISAGLVSYMRLTEAYGQEHDGQKEEGTSEAFRLRCREVVEEAMEDHLLGFPGVGFTAPFLTLCAQHPDKLTVQEAANHISGLTIVKPGYTSTFDARCEYMTSMLNRSFGTSIPYSPSRSPLPRLCRDSSALVILGTTPFEDPAALSVLRNPEDEEDTQVVLPVLDNLPNATLERILKASFQGMTIRGADSLPSSQQRRS